jgi:hypothetical protein
MGESQESSFIPWDLCLFSFGAFGFVFAATALTTIDRLYYFYRRIWTWNELGADTVGRFITESEAKVEELLGR